MRRTFSRQPVRVAAGLTLFAAGAPARADILDDILDLAKGAKTYALSARDRAIEARNNAAAARDSASEIRDELRESLSHLSEEMRSAIRNGAEDLQRQLVEEREGLDAFTAGPDGCSTGECVPFRERLIDMLEQIETVFNAVLVISDAEDFQIDLHRERELIRQLPGRLLFPLYRSGLFNDDTLLSALREASDDLVIVAEVIQEDRERACAYVVENEAAAEEAIESLQDKARVLKIAGKLFSALGKIPIQPEAAAWGWVGVVVKLEPAEKVATALEGLSDALESASDSASKRIRECTKGGENSKIKENQKEMMKDLEKLLRRQKDLQTDVDRILELLEDDPNP
ncbi:MAG: hypothetical protein KJ057_02715 [Phycisphaerae bacterium]|nr:MAG: hypothetical protein F9K17_11245 [Phycisphaerae bacterium]MBE7457562.1 hypothetical protein [Planctomycetia bacterium]MCK6464600.1 hypothetical protein [Phycisphaerae bacterium]MCL4717364.1 hypothetical protein [Phycisphaerae bacterium]NUQ08262.1 hypothetical protein [Phycisphaerae bacterium]